MPVALVFYLSINCDVLYLPKIAITQKNFVIEHVDVNAWLREWDETAPKARLLRAFMNDIDTISAFFYEPIISVL